MKVFAISDLHLSINEPKPMDIFGGSWDNYIEKICASWEENVSDEDVVLIAGDISWAMSLEGAKPDLDFIGSLKGTKIIIRGNHDYWWKSISAVRAALSNRTLALQNDCIKLGEFVICGSRGWTTPERGRTMTEADRTIYSREIIRMELSLKEAQKLRLTSEKLIAMIHYPPFNIRLDPSPFTDLFIKYGVDAVVYGHLHGKDSLVMSKVSIDKTDYFLTSCDLIKNKLVRIF